MNYWKAGLSKKLPAMSNCLFSHQLLIRHAASNLLAYSVGSSFPYPLNLGTWAIFCSFGICAGAGCIFSIAFANAVMAWAIILFYFPSGGLFPFPSFIPTDGWFGGWFRSWFEG